MTERPIIFSGPMVRAILNGRKTQTRRVVVPAPFHDGDDGRWIWTNGRLLHACYCPYGQPGDRLWVRETGWERPARTPRMMREGADTWERYYYDADGANEIDHDLFKEWKFKRRPAIHMPRWASRITLEVTGVRGERLQEISEDDAKAEGVDEEDFPPPPETEGYTFNYPAGFRSVWDTINAKRAPWASNPWVWVVEFKHI